MEKKVYMIRLQKRSYWLNRKQLLYHSTMNTKINKVITSSVFKFELVPLPEVLSSKSLNPKKTRRQGDHWTRNRSLN